jgi:taurine transport system substrate-binding protein
MRRAAAPLLALVLVLTFALAARGREVTIGYQLIVGPWAAAVATGEVEAATGWQIRWVKFESGRQVVDAFSHREIDAGFLGSSPLATALSGGLDLRLVWVLDDIAAAEQLVVRDGSGIDPGDPASLQGRTVSVPFGSTTHYHLLVALELWGIGRDTVRIVDLEPNEIATAWERGAIDAAFIWQPVLGRLLENGRTMVTSAELSAKGQPTFDALVATPELLRDDPDGLAALVGTFARRVQAFRADPAAWSVDSAEVAAILALFGGSAEDVVAALGLYHYPTAREQVGPDWLGDGGDGRVARSLLATARFLAAEGRIDTVLEDYGRFVDPSLAAAAIASR